MILRMGNLKQIQRILRKHKEELKLKYHIKEIGIFGSFVRGDEKKSSDIDILVEFQETIGFFKFLELEEYLSKILGKKLILCQKKLLSQL